MKPVPEPIADFAQMSADDHLAQAACRAAEADGYSAGDAIDLAWAQLHVSWATALLMQAAADKK
jgi:hypothetical protein